MCWICNASNSVEALLWTMTRLGAGWRDTVRTHESYLAELAAAGKVVPALFKILSLRLEGIMCDILHAVDQGLASHLIANVLVEILGLNVWGTTQKANVAGLDKDLQAWYKATQDKTKVQGKLTYERLKTKGEWPKLKAKAAATRHLAKYAAYLAVLHNDGSTHDRLRKAVCELLCRFYAIIDEEGRFLSDGAKQELPVLGRTLLELYLKLSKEAIVKHKRMWKSVPKFHVFVHICDLAVVLGNPKYYWTYSDEDLQRVIKEVATSCHPRNMEQVVLYKWLIYTFELNV